MGRRKLPQLPKEQQPLSLAQAHTLSDEQLYRSAGVDLRYQSSAAYRAISQSALSELPYNVAQMAQHQLQQSALYPPRHPSRPASASPGLLPTITSRARLPPNMDKMPNTLARVLLKQELKEALCKRRDQLSQCEIEANQRQYAVHRMLVSGMMPDSNSLFGKHDHGPDIIKCELPLELLQDVRVTPPASRGYYGASSLTRSTAYRHEPVGMSRSPSQHRVETTGVQTLTTPPNISYSSLPSSVRRKELPSQPSNSDLTSSSLRFRSSTLQNRDRERDISPLQNNAETQTQVRQRHASDKYYGKYDRRERLRDRDGGGSSAEDLSSARRRRRTAGGTASDSDTPLRLPPLPPHPPARVSSLWDLEDEEDTPDDSRGGKYNSSLPSSILRRSRRRRHSSKYSSYWFSDEDDPEAREFRKDKMRAEIERRRERLLNQLADTSDLLRSTAEDHKKAISELDLDRRSPTEMKPAESQQPPTSQREPNMPVSHGLGPAQSLGANLTLPRTSMYGSPSSAQAAGSKTAVASTASQQQHSTTTTAAATTTATTKSTTATAGLQQAHDQWTSATGAPSSSTQPVPYTTIASTSMHDTRVPNAALQAAQYLQYTSHAASTPMAPHTSMPYTTASAHTQLHPDTLAVTSQQPYYHTQQQAAGVAAGAAPPIPPHQNITEAPTPANQTLLDSMANTRFGYDQIYGPAGGQYPPSSAYPPSAAGMAPFQQRLSRSVYEPLSRSVGYLSETDKLYASATGQMPQYDPYSAPRYGQLGINAPHHRSMDVYGASSGPMSAPASSGYDPWYSSQPSYSRMQQPFHTPAAGTLLSQYASYLNADFQMRPTAMNDYAQGPPVSQYGQRVPAQYGGSYGTLYDRVSTLRQQQQQAQAQQQHQAGMPMQQSSRAYDSMAYPGVSMSAPTSSYGQQLPYQQSYPYYSSTTTVPGAAAYQNDPYYTGQQQRYDQMLQQQHHLQQQQQQQHQRLAQVPTSSFAAMSMAQQQAAQDPYMRTTMAPSFSGANSLLTTVQSQQRAMQQAQQPQPPFSQGAPRPLAQSAWYQNAPSAPGNPYYPSSGGPAGQQYGTLYRGATGTGTHTAPPYGLPAGATLRRPQSHPAQPYGERQTNL